MEQLLSVLAPLYGPGPSVCSLTTGSFRALETKTPRILLEVTCSGVGKSETGCKGIVMV